MASNAEFGFNTPFKEQLDFFRQKLNLPTERWDDIVKSAHDKAFIVAGAANADMLQDFRAAIDKAIAQGTGLEQFRKDFKAIVAKYGWTNYTGSGSAEGIAWRTKVIYQTNMSTSYAAGRYKQLTDPEYLKLRPNWKYVHNDSVMHPRPLHLSWDGIVLPHDHPFWLTHFGPNGWGCECRVVPARGGEAIKQPPHGWDSIDPKTGAPVGIDKGFDYAPGASLKPFIAPPLDDSPKTFATGVVLSKYIAPEKYPANILLARKAEPEYYATQFLEKFGATIDSPIVFKDVTGEPLVIDVSLFKDGAGDWKSDKDGRGQYMLLLADAVKKPDEIWLRWEESRDYPGKWLLKRRYIKSFEVEGENGTHYGLTVFEFNKSGWSGSTAMMANPDRSQEARERYIEKQRDGVLIYQK